MFILGDFVVVSLLKLFSHEVYAKYGGMPSKDFGSDHIMLMADLVHKE